MTLSDKAPPQMVRVGWQRLLHNPWLLEPSEFLRGFVLRQDVLAELVALIRQATSDGPDKKPAHLMLTGGRGMGKTTLLRRLALFIEQDPDLSRTWIPLSFSEEPYEIGDVADWLVVAMRRLAVILGDSASARVPSDSELAAAGSRKSLASSLYARLVAACASVGKRPLLLCDNFDMLLAQIGPGEQRTLCRLLRSDPRAMILASALVITREVERASPLLPLFRLRPLAPLTVDEHLHLLERLALSSEDAASRVELTEHPERARQFYPLTGGNPRITAVLYRVLSATATEALDLRRDLELLLDELTPLYKSQIDQLAPQQRRICDVLARTWHPQSLAELTERLRLPGNTITSQLGRLRTQGYIVVAESGSGERLRYSLAERLFNIFWLMRSSGESHCNLRWLSLFLQSFFSQDQLQEAARHLGQSWEQSSGQPSTNSVERFAYLASITSALADPQQQLATLASALTLAEKIPETDRHRATSTTLDELLSTIEMPVSTAIELGAIRSALERLVVIYPLQLRAWFLLASARTLQGDLAQAATAARRAIALSPEWLAPHLLLAKILDRQGDMTAARGAAEQAVRCDPVSPHAWSLLGHIQLFCPDQDIEGCLSNLSRAAELDPKNGSRWRILSVALFECSQFENAMRAVRRAVQFEPQNLLNWAVLAVLTFIGGVGSKVPPPGAAWERRFDPWFLVRAIYYRLFDIVGPPSSGLEGASLRSAAEHPWRHWAVLYVPHWLLRDVEGLLMQELLRDPRDALLRGSLALILGRRGKWTQAFREVSNVAQTAPARVLQTYHHMFFGLFILAGACGQAGEAGVFLSAHPELVRSQPALMAALELRAMGQNKRLDALPSEERAVAEVFLRCMQQVDELAKLPVAQLP